MAGNRKTANISILPFDSLRIEGKKGSNKFFGATQELYFAFYQGPSCSNPTLNTRAREFPSVEFISPYSQK
jgi:hypothetical protein